MNGFAARIAYIFLLILVLTDPMPGLAEPEQKQEDQAVVVRIDSRAEEVMRSMAAHLADLVYAVSSLPARFQVS